MNHPQASGIDITDLPIIPPAGGDSDLLITRLQAHLPYSLPLLRRLQCARNLPGGCTPHAHVLCASYAQEQGEAGNGERSVVVVVVDQQQAKSKDCEEFAAAYVDLSCAPETQCWIYSTLEDGVTTTTTGGKGGGDGVGEGDEREEDGIGLVLALLRRVRAVALAGSCQEGGGEGMSADWKGKEKEAVVLVGSLHEAIRQRLLASGVRMAKPANGPADQDWELCDKWLFRIEDFPLPLPLPGSEEDRGWGSQIPLPEGMRWDRVQRQDLGLVLDRTDIKRRKESTLLMLPSCVVRLADGTPIAWAFMGLDGTLISLHVEEPYRRLGLAKAVACKLMRDHLRDYGDDGWGAADVFMMNHNSQALCKSIGGKLSWILSWAEIDLSSVGDPM